MHFWKHILELHFLKLFYIHLADREKDSMLIIFLSFYKPHPFVWPKRGHILEGKNLLTMKQHVRCDQNIKFLQKYNYFTEIQLFFSYGLNHVSPLNRCNQIETALGIKITFLQELPSTLAIRSLYLPQKPMIFKTLQVIYA